MVTKRKQKRAVKPSSVTEQNIARGAVPEFSQKTPRLYLSIVIVATVGLLLTLYLTMLTWLKLPPVACGVGSSCEAVQSSRWASLLGIPISLYGFLFYLTVLSLVWRISDLEKRWRWIWRCTLPAITVSLYLNAVSFFVINAICIYCLASLLLVVAIFVLAILARPSQLPIKRFLQYAGGGVLAVLVAIQLAYTLPTWLQWEEDPYLSGLAEHLNRSGAVMYGAFWCAACKEQLSYFKNSEDRLPYEECSTKGVRGPQAPICVINGVESYPTWFIGGEKRVGVIKLKELARLTSYEPPPEEKPEEIEEEPAEETPEEEEEPTETS